MKKFIKIGAVAMMVLALSGCSSFKGLGVDAQKEQEGTKEEITVTPDITIDQEAAENQETKGEDSEMVDTEPVIVMLDPGHGGGYAGASYNGRIEKEMTLKVANYAKEYLEENYSQITVYMTRDTDTALAGEVALDLENRAIAAKEVGADILVSLHFNATESHNQQGALVIVSHRDNVSKQCRELGEKILTELSALGIENDGLLTKNSNDMMDENGKPLDYYAINRHCANRDFPGVIVEHCYMDNANDEQFIQSDEALKALGIADAKGIAAYLGLKEK